MLKAQRRINIAGAYHSVFQAIGSYDAVSKIFTAGSLNANVTSSTITPVGAMPTCSATVWVEANTSVITGTFFVDVTDDLRASDPGTAANAKWVTVQSIVYTNGVDPNSNSSSQIVWINGSKFARVRWTNTSGTGTGGAMVTGVGG